MNSLPKRALPALALACALVAAVSAPAAPAAVADSPCWKKLLNDWYDGRIDNLYPIPCYQQAIDHLPTDIKVYSSAHDDIERALQAAIKHQQTPSTPPPTITDEKPPTTPATTTTETTPAKTTPAKTTPAPAVTTPGRTTPKGPVPSVIDSSSPGGATSFPLPLLILGGLALFLLAAGVVGLAVRRMQNRGDGGEPPAPA